MQRSTFNKMKRSNWPQHWSLTKPHIIPPSTLNWSFVFLLIQICLIQNTLSSRYILVKHDCRVVMEKIKTNWICAASKLIAHSWHCPFMTHYKLLSLVKLSYYSRFGKSCYIVLTSTLYKMMTDIAVTMFSRDFVVLRYKTHQVLLRSMESDLRHNSRPD